MIKIIKSLWQRFLDLKLFNVAKLFSSIYFVANLTLLHQNACLWLQSFIKHFNTNERNSFNEHGLKSKF